MIKQLVGALLGALSFAVVLPCSALLVGWAELGDLSLAVFASCAAAGAVLGWLRPGLFIKTLLFFIEPNLFD